MILHELQQKLRVPKTHWNDHGKFKYRNAEDILEAIKKHLKDYQAVITFEEEIVCVGERYYSKVKAILEAPGYYASRTAWAREADQQKGMNSAQLSGSTSSYAKKYALGYLLALDDSEEIDSPEDQIETISDKQLADLEALILEVSADTTKFCKWFKITSVENLPADKFKDACKMLEAKRGK